MVFQRYPLPQSVLPISQLRHLFKSFVINRTGKFRLAITTGGHHAEHSHGPRCLVSPTVCVCMHVCLISCQLEKIQERIPISVFFNVNFVLKQHQYAMSIVTSSLEKNHDPAHVKSLSYLVPMTIWVCHLQLGPITGYLLTQSLPMRKVLLKVLSILFFQ